MTISTFGSSCFRIWGGYQYYFKFCHSQCHAVS